MPVVLDYLRFRSLLDCSQEPQGFKATFLVEYSETPLFNAPKIGVISLGSLDLGIDDTDAASKAASALEGKVFYRTKGEDREVHIFHIHGLPLGSWLSHQVRKNYS
ncbi:MAG: hypothetical protein QXI19_11495 [Candidatus Caldarchaeum sp.]